VPKYDQELDASHLTCPLPILRAKNVIEGMASGEILRVITTEPGAIKDFEAFTRQTGHTLLEFTEQEGHFYFLLQKK
jgi:tRNA 2-thiouridine synthesizing protein A